MALDTLIHRSEAPWYQQVIAAPYVAISKSLYARRQRLLAPLRSLVDPHAISIVCVSDTHNTRPDLPHGDLLIHGGDLTQNGTFQELQDQLNWLNAQPHEHKIVIAGNHDSILDSARVAEYDLLASGRQPIQWAPIIYLKDSAANVVLANKKRLSLYGSPHTQRHGNWAFQYSKGADVFSGRVPLHTDVLITHSPPKFHLDVAGWGEMKLLQELWRVRPRVHIFGHIHAGAGQDVLVYDHFEKLYEEVRDGGAGMIALLHMALLLLLMYLGLYCCTAERTILVNASVVGGLLDRSSRDVRVVSL